MVSSDIKQIFTQVYKLTQFSNFLKKEVKYVTKKSSTKKSLYKNNNQYCHLTIAYYNLSITAPKTLKPCSQLYQNYTGANRGCPVWLNGKRHLGDLKNKIKKYVGREAFICVIQSVFKNQKKKKKKV